MVQLAWFASRLQAVTMKKIQPNIRFLVEDMAGAVLVEMAIMLSIVLIIFLGLIEVGGATWQSVEATISSQAGVLAAMRYGAAGGFTAVNAAVEKAGDFSPATVTPFDPILGCPDATGKAIVAGCNEGPLAGTYFPITTTKARISYSGTNWYLLDALLPSITTTVMVRVK